MAYSRMKEDACPTPGGDPGILQLHLVNTIAKAEYLLKVPWNNCVLAYAYAVVANVLVDATTDWAIAFKKSTSSGTLIGGITIPKTSAIGTATDWSKVNTEAASAARKNLMNSDLLYVSSQGDGTGPTGECEMYFYFEPTPLA
jgi:hypothetical protein